MKDDLVPVDELIPQDKLDRETDEALRLAKIYVTNRLIALRYHLNHYRPNNKSVGIVQDDLVVTMRRIADSVKKHNPHCMMFRSFADNLPDVLRLPNSVSLVEQMAYELDPHWERRSILPAAPEPSWRDWRYSGSSRSW